MGSYSPRFDDAVLDLAGPRVCFVPTPSGDQVVRFYESFAHRAEATHISFNPWPRADLREHLLSRDAIYVSGGNTANALAIWRAHGFDEILREAWQRGILMCGWSAGMLCWFEAGVTDSFGPRLARIEGLGWLAGSNCPHYDGEAERRPTYHRLVGEGMVAGVAADDGVGLHFVDGRLHRVVSSRPDARAYRVERDGDGVRETPIVPELLAG